MSQTRVDIERLAITLQGVPSADAERIVQLLEPALVARLGSLAPEASPAMRLGHADLGVVDAAAGTDAHAMADAIAARLVDWIGDQTAPAKREET